MDWKPDIPRWRQVYAVMEERIADGTYSPGGRLPSVVDVCAEFEISQMTARKVLQKLRDEGLAYMEPGIGTFTSPLPEAPAAQEGPPPG
jgi:DNA-binding GntR family transcriptional regulator